MIWIDGHVHFHSCFALETFLLSAAKNFSNAAISYGRDGVPMGVLLLTEGRGADFFSGWRASAGKQIAPDLSFQVTQEEGSLKVLIEGEPRLLVVAGRQIQTAEDLEVLAIGMIEHLEDGASIREILHAVRQADAVAVIPWGFGKWWFARGRTMRGLIESGDVPRFLLGDNGGRVCWGSEPRLFGLARQSRIGVLPGSDPLPFPNQVDRAGRCGARLDMTLSLQRPAEELKKALRERSPELVGYGKGEHVGSFVRNQVALQVKKRWRISKR